MKKLRKWQFLFESCKKKSGLILILFLSVIFQVLLEIRFALGTQKVIDFAVEGNVHDFTNACIKLLLIIIVINVCLFLSNHSNQKLETDIDAIMKGKMLHYLLNGEYEAVTEYHSGELINRMNGDVQSLCAGVVSIIPDVIGLITQMISSILVLMTRAADFTIILLIFCISITCVSLLVRSRLKLLYKKVSEENGKLSGLLQELITKLLMIQALDVTDEAEERGIKALERRRKIQYKRKNINLAFNTSANCLAYFISFFSITFFAYRLLNGRMSFGELTAMTQIAALLVSPFLALPGLARNLVSMTASVERINEVIQISPQPENIENIDEIADNMESIEAKNITFSYKNGTDEYVLDNISFKIPIGGMTVITGSSGIGKSTILKLLLGIHNVDKGKLTVNTGNSSIPISRSTRKLFSYVPQGNLLLSGTIYDNIILTKPDASESEISSVLYTSCMDEYINDLPQGMYTELRENGNGISEGQGQRISIARAVLREAPILLLDEVTSALDMETEKSVLSRLSQLKGKTCIVVTHRLEILKMVDLHLHITKDGIMINPKPDDLK